MKVNLINGLIKMIAEVEKLPEHTVFTMENYNLCVIGKTIGWEVNGKWVPNKESRLLRRIFGIKKDDYGLFSGDATLYTERTWKVICLFTDYIGEKVERDYWLKLAKQTLAELQSA